jgi:hypothetical protein
VASSRRTAELASPSGRSTPGSSDRPAPQGGGPRPRVHETRAADRAQRGDHLGRAGRLGRCSHRGVTRARLVADGSGRSPSGAGGCTDHCDPDDSLGRSRAACPRIGPGRSTAGRPRIDGRHAAPGTRAAAQDAEYAGRANSRTRATCRLDGRGSGIAALAALTS